jgi:hypothetical protein
MTQPQKYSFTVAIANVIGTGVFTSIGSLERVEFEN